MLKYFLLAFVVALSGCADSSTKGSMKETETEFKFNFSNNTGEINFYAGTELATLAGNTEQKTENESDVSPTTTVKIPIAEGGSSAVTGAASELSNMLDTSKISTVSEVLQPVTDVLQPVTDLLPTGATKTETYTLKHSADRGRQVTWMKQHGDKYGLPMVFKLDGSCNKTITINKLNPKPIGSTSWTVVEDLHWSTENHDKAEFLAPMDCTGSTGMSITYQVKS